MNQSYIAKPSLLLLREHCVQLLSCAAIEVNFSRKENNVGEGMNSPE